MQSCGPSLRGCLSALPQARHVAAFWQSGLAAARRVDALALQRQPVVRHHAAWAGLAPCLQQQPRAIAAQRLNVSIRSASTAASAPAETRVAEAPSAAERSWEIKMLYDGDCPLCMREVNMLRRRDAENGKIEFVDVASPDYDPSAHAGISFKQAMGEIHAILPDGRVVTNIEVFKRLYEAVGLGWVYRFAEIEPLRRAADALYGVWAQYRMPITGRPDLATILEQRSKKTCGPSS